MIPYASLDWALGRWKSKQAGDAPAAPGAPAEEAPRRKHTSNLDWSMEQAMGSAPTETSSGDTSEVGGEAIVGEDAVVAQEGHSSGPTDEVIGDATAEHESGQRTDRE